MITITAITFIVLFIRCRKKKNLLQEENDALKIEIARLNQTIINMKKEAQKA